MKQLTMRRIDRFVGTVLCALLTGVRRIAERAERPERHEPPRRILFLKLIEQGATVLAWDAIRVARERVGRDNLYFCVFAENRFILDALDVVPADHVIAIRSERLISFLLDCARALMTVRRARIDAVVDMEFFSRAPAIFAYLTGARLRAGLHGFTAEGPYRGDLMTHRLQYNPYLHVSQAYRSLVDALWTDGEDIPLLKARPAPLPALPRFEPTDERRALVRAKLHAAARGPVAGPLVLFNVNATDAMPLRRWPVDRFLELGRRLLAERRDVVLVLTGMAAECPVVDAMCAELGPRAISLAGRTTLTEMLVLFTLADVLVTSDSGPGHFASLTNVHSIVLFGPETPATFGPIGPRSEAITAGLACSPCFTVFNHRRSPCRDNVCLRAISVDDVLARVRATLGAPHQLAADAVTAT